MCIQICHNTRKVWRDNLSIAACEACPGFNFASRSLPRVDSKCISLCHHFCSSLSISKAQWCFQTCPSKWKLAIKCNLELFQGVFDWFSSVALNLWKLPIMTDFQKCSLLAPGAIVLSKSTGMAGAAEEWRGSFTMRSFKSGALFHFWTTSFADFAGPSSSCDPETINMLLYSTLLPPTSCSKLTPSPPTFHPPSPPLQPWNYWRVPLPPRRDSPWAFFQAITRHMIWWHDMFRTKTQNNQLFSRCVTLEMANLARFCGIVGYIPGQTYTIICLFHRKWILKV